MTARALAGIAFSILPAYPAAQSVWVVDDTPGPGVDFASIQTAVTAAAEGDVILVRAGSYASFVVFAKSLVISADLGAQVDVAGGFAVRALSSTQSVVVRGVDIVGPNEEGAYLRDDAGPVWIEDCVLRGGLGDNTYPGAFAGEPLDSHPGARVAGCDEVVFARCEMWGGNGLDLWDEDFEYAPGGGGDGLLVQGGRVSVFDCALSGGNGGTVNDTVQDTGGAGGTGAAIESGEVLASGCHLAGGKGGYADSDIFGCGDGGAGGDGFLLDFGGAPALRWQDCTFAPALGGGAGAAACSPGAAGTNVEVYAGSAVALPGTARTLAVSSPHREGETSTFTLGGEPGDSAVVAVAGAQAHLPLDAFAGNLVLDPAFAVYPMGVVPPSGVLSVPVAIPAAPNPATLARKVYVQSAHVGAGPAVWLGHGSALLMLDAGL